MARKRHTYVGFLRLLREVEVHLATGSDVQSANRSACNSDAIYYKCRKRYGAWAAEEDFCRA